MNGAQGKRKSQSVRNVSRRIGIETEGNDYYVYVWLDPRKPGKFKYGRYKFNYEPIYVGKGKGQRCWCFDRQYNGILNAKINKIGTPICIQLVKYMTNEQSLLEEIRIISLIGRINDGTGPLANLTGGGEGGSNLSEADRQRISKKVHDSLLGNQRRKGIPHSLESKRKMSLAGKGKPKSESHKANMRLGHKGGVKFHSEETKRKMSATRIGEGNGMFGRHHSEETRALISRLAKERADKKRREGYRHTIEKGEINEIHTATN